MNPKYIYKQTRGIFRKETVIVHSQRACNVCPEIFYELFKLEIIDFI